VDRAEFAVWFRAHPGLPAGAAVDEARRGRAAVVAAAAAAAHFQVVALRRHQVGAGTPGLTVEDLREYNKQDSRTALVEGYLARLVAAPGGAEGARAREAGVDMTVWERRFAVVRPDGRLFVYEGREQADSAEAARAEAAVPAGEPAHQVLSHLNHSLNMVWYVWY
jgi:hypothetical protein